MAAQVVELNGGNCKTYLVVSGDEAVLVDPVRERLASYEAAIAARGVRLTMVLETHLHADHLLLNREAKRILGVPVAMHRLSPSPLVDRHLEDGDVIRVGDTEMTVLHTPGHTPCSVCYRLPGAVLTGDTLLIGGSGRTDFPGGDAAAQYEAVTSRLFAMPDETVVYPGHDYQGRTSSTIGAERASNPRFLGKTSDAYVAQMAALGLPFPDRIQQVLQVNQSGCEADEVPFPKVAEVRDQEGIGAERLHDRLTREPPPVVLDVREPEEFTGALGHIRGALPVPLDALAQRLPKLVGYSDLEIVVVCRAGARSASAAVVLKGAGFKDVKNLDGGMLAWVEAGLPVEH
jgi:glyoxylase-like metal-dependent hydrolase (beta-lactamase superfamily II)/rhodanese-related sulfurtransferase